MPKLERTVVIEDVESNFIFLLIENGKGVLIDLIDMKNFEGIVKLFLVFRIINSAFGIEANMMDKIFRDILRLIEYFDVEVSELVVFDCELEPDPPFVEEHELVIVLEWPKKKGRLEVEFNFSFEDGRGIMNLVEGHKSSFNGDVEL